MTASKGAVSIATTSMVAGMRRDRMETGLDAVRRANARRVQCPHCPLTIAPEGLDRHIRISHTEDDDDA